MLVTGKINYSNYIDLPQNTAKHNHKSGINLPLLNTITSALLHSQPCLLGFTVTIYVVLLLQIIISANSKFELHQVIFLLSIAENEEP
jgi:hypothetical protein